MNKPALILIGLLLASSVFADEVFSIRYVPGEKFKIIEKTDMSKRTNTGYSGYLYREVRGVCEVSPGSAPDNPAYAGKFYVLEEMKKEDRAVAKKLDETFPVSFSIKPDGEYVVKSGAYPTLRGFPVFSSKPVPVGGKWQAYGLRIVEPRRDGVYTKVKIYSDYTYKGKGDLNGVPCDVITAQYAMRYKQGDDPDGDKNLKEISGKHVVTIYFDAERTRPLFMRDNVEEIYTFADGVTETYKGFILTWFDMVIVLDRTQVADRIKNDLDVASTPDVVVEKRPEGVALVINKIHFLPDQALVRPDEADRLRQIADTLKKIPGRTFLVRGHTAKIGAVETQESLSVDRAKMFVDYLVSQGIPADRLLYEGRGANEPVATNDTEEGRVQNRRVEIIILED